MALPKFLQGALWSYDLSKMDARDESDKRIIIEQILNFGTGEQLKWLYKTYSDKEIKGVVKKPSRGIWTPESLNFWTKYFKVSLVPEVYKRAIMNINPAF